MGLENPRETSTKRAGFQVQPRNKDTQREGVLQDTSDTLSNYFAVVLFNPITYTTDKLRLSSIPYFSALRQAILIHTYI